MLKKTKWLQCDSFVYQKIIRDLSLLGGAKKIRSLSFQMRLFVGFPTRLTLSPWVSKKRRNMAGQGSPLRLAASRAADLRSSR